MIFVATGSQKFQFNRLLRTIDKLVKEGLITEPVYAQTGYSTYKPKYYRSSNFVPTDLLNQMLEDSNIVITHGGTGIIINSLKRHSKVIGVPRLKKFHEHVDDHQVQLLNEFKKQGLIEVCTDLNDLQKTIDKVKSHSYSPYNSNRQDILSSIKQYIESQG